MNQVETILSSIPPIDIRAELFKNKNFDFIVKREVDGVVKEHKKQRKALEVLTSNKYSEFLFGGAANGAKTWTGCSWLLFMAILYPETRWFVARNELRDLEGSVLVTFKKVCKMYGFTDYKYNAVKHYITFGNGSVINFIEIKYKPSDPLFEDLGSTEYTGGWIEEVGEIHEVGAQVISKRAGRHMNDHYGIKKIIFYTCNPKKNWAKREFYDKWKKGELEPHKFYLPSLVQDNPFREKGSAEDLESYKHTNKVLYERLFKGNWDYEDNPFQLTEDEMIDAMFENDHVGTGKRYITADVARFGSDKARIGYWEGWILREVISLDISKTTDIELAIRTLRHKYKIPRTRCIVDSDGVGGGVADGAGVKGFRNNARAIRKGKDSPNYKNLQVQCLYHLADKINNGEIWVNADLTGKERDEIKEEMAQIQSKGDPEPDRKLDCKSKADIKQAIGRSPDWRDCFSGETKVLTKSGYKRIDAIKTGDYVTTPYGYRRVTDTIVRNAPNTLYSVNGTICTGNHKFFTKKGFVRSDTLTMKDYIYTDNIINFIVWRIRRLLSMADLNIGFQRRQTIITQKGKESTAKELKSHSIEKYMRTIMGRFLKTSTYTILTETLLTTAHQIWRLLKKKHIEVTTQKRTGRIKNIGKKESKTLAQCNTRQNNGTSLRKEGNGIEKTQKNTILGIGREGLKNVKTAILNTPKTSRFKDFVQIDAYKNGIIKKERTKKQGFASIAIPNSVSANRNRLSAAQTSVLQNKDRKIEKVYTLTVDKDNCYFANGMLVENCMLMRCYFDIKKTTADLTTTWR